MADEFFVSWALWQQMTFVLASGIVIVVIWGVWKLWWTGRKGKKQALLDLEKRNSAPQKRTKNGQQRRRRQNTVPFGARAIQSGVEVEGIWISRPASPTHVPNLSSVKLTSQSTLVSDIDAMLLAKARAKQRQHNNDDDNSSGRFDEKAHRSTRQAPPNHHPLPPQQQHQQPGSQGQSPQRSPTFDFGGSHHGGNGSAPQTGNNSPNMSSYAPNFSWKRPSSQLRNNDAAGSDEETLQRLEGRAAPARDSRATFDTYIPTTRSVVYSGSGYGPPSIKEAKVAGERHSGSSEESERSSAMSSVRLPAKARHPSGGPPQTYVVRRGGVASNGSADQGLSPTPHHSMRHQERTARRVASTGFQSVDETMEEPGAVPITAAAADEAPQVPMPTFGAGELHLNKSTRRVKEGFEVLPAGTFGPPRELATPTASDLELDAQIQGGVRRPRGSSRRGSSGRTLQKSRPS